MQEREHEVKVIRVVAVCPKCDHDTLSREEGAAPRMADPPLIPHECTNCGHREDIRGKSYPYIRYEEKHD